MVLNPSMMSGGNAQVVPVQPDHIEGVCKDVDAKIADDKRFPDLAEQLKINPTGPATFSGVNYFDYSSATTGSQTEAETAASYPNQLCTVKKIQLPDELTEQFSYVQCNCMMGLFPEISRAWLAIDSDIYVWNYEDGSDVAYFDGLSEIILAAGLVRPKDGIFQGHIRYLLCLTTPVNIVVLGVSFSKDRGSEFGEMHLQPDPLFCVPSDNVYMTCVTGSAVGRIFMCGKDGCIYELDYQARDSWFRRKCRKINHSASSLSYVVPSFLSQAFSEEDPLLQISIDNSRNILYSRSSKGCLQVYDLGMDGFDFRCVSHLSEGSIANYAFNAARNMNMANFKPIVHIAPVSKSESTYIHLVAVTEAGARLYFSTMAPSVNDTRPQSLRLVHVRMPPGFTPVTSSMRPSHVHMAFYRQGTTLLASSARDGVDAIWCLSQESFPFQISLRETEVASQVVGRTWCLTEIPECTTDLSPSLNVFSFQWPEPPSVVTQHAFPARRFVLLSSKGSHIITTMRPIEQLRDVLASAQRGDSERVAAFFEAYGATESLAMCLALACQSADADSVVVEWAVHAFFTLSDAPSQSQQRMANLASPADRVQHADQLQMSATRSAAPAGSNQGSFLASPIPRSDPQSYGAPSPGFMSSTASPGCMSSTASFPPRASAEAASVDRQLSRSSRYFGIVLYMSRILRPLWHFPITSEVVVDNRGPAQLWSRLSSVELTWFIQRLRTLREFMDRYSHFATKGSPTDTARYRLMSPQMYKKGASDGGEAASVKQLGALVGRCCESLELWRVVCDHQLHIMAQTFPVELKDKLRHTTFRDFVCSGHEIISALVNGLMAKYLDDNAAIDAISDHLREICPTLYSADDALYSKANEMLANCRTMQDSVEKQSLIDDAVQLYKKIPNLIDVCWISEQLRAAHSYSSIVNLMLYVALKRDPKGLALHRYKYQQQSHDLDDDEGKAAMKARQDAYHALLESLDHLKSFTERASSSPLPDQPGFLLKADPNRLPVEYARQLFDEMLSMCFDATDELFHVTLYQWLIGKGLTDLMLNVSAPYLEQFLINTAAEQHPKNLGMLDLLWKHYERRKNYMAAAKVLLNLAEREGTSLTIHERLEYLSRAIMCAKSCGLRTSGSGEGELLRELEEKLDVARIQLQIYQELTASRPHRPGTTAGRAEAIGRLDSQLIEISDLYGDYADKFDLPACKLAIVHCANHYDAVLIETIWRELLGEVFLDTASLSPVTRMATINQRLVSIGKGYVHHERYFPLSFVILLLETKSCELQWDPSWALSTLIDMGVAFPVLCREYDRLVKSKDPMWEAKGKPLHLIGSVALLVRHFLQSNEVAQHQDRIPLARFLLDVCVSYLVELEAMSGQDGAAQTLLKNFRSLQVGLKRMI